MTEEQADMIINLLEGISEKLSSIEFKLDSIEFNTQDIGMVDFTLSNILAAIRGID